MSVLVAACSYQLDADYRLVSVDRAWTAFAVANDAPELVPPGPLGRPIWTFISDSTTKHLYERMLDRVMAGGPPIRVPIRCDAPTLRRFLDLSVARGPAGVIITTTVTRVEPRPAVRLMDREARRSPGEMLVMCSWCKRIRTPAGWVEAEEAILRLGLFEADALPEITHGMCPQCFDQIS